MPRRPANVEVLAALAKVLHKRKIRWYVFGAQAAVVYGSPRMTMDVDVTVAFPTKACGGPWWMPCSRPASRRGRTTSGVLHGRSRVVPLCIQRTRMPLDPWWR